MPESKLRKFLEEEAGMEEIRLVIPHPLLPPRFRILSEERNMILILDENMVTRITWEGSRMEEYQPLNPAAAGQLLKEVCDRIIKYRRDLQGFEAFIREWGEKPFDEPQPLDPPPYAVREKPAAKCEKEVEEEVTVLAEIKTKKPAHKGLTTSELIRQRSLKRGTSS